MDRSPMVRFVAAAILIVFIVVATFLYGNAQRSKQQQTKQQARVEKVQKQSEQKRDEQKDKTQQSEQVVPADSMQPVKSVPSVPEASPQVTKIPTTGGGGALSLLLAGLILPALVVLRRRQLLNLV